MNEHPAHGHACVIRSAAKSLHGCVNLANPSAAYLTPGDHVELLREIHGALLTLGRSVVCIAEVTQPEEGLLRLARAASLVKQACEQIAIGAIIITDGSPDAAGAAARCAQQGDADQPDRRLAGEPAGHPPGLGTGRSDFPVPTWRTYPFRPPAGGGDDGGASAALSPRRGPALLRRPMGAGRGGRGR